MSTGGKVALILGLIVLVVLVCAGIVAAVVSTSSTPKPPIVGPTGQLAGSQGQPVATPTAKVAYPTPAAKDFTITPKITNKQCFGSAGCNVQFTVNLDYTGTPVKPSSSWDVTYEAQGTEDPLTVTLRLDFDPDGKNGAYQNDEQFVQTKTKAAKITLVITSITPA